MLWRRRHGSPPLARGNLPRRNSGGVAGGFTPARAGKSLCIGLRRLSWRVHPRSRGEIVGGLGLVVLLMGFTPARAGKSPSSGGNRPGYWVHPRSRGEISVSELVAIFDSGSPPLARGNRRIWRTGMSTRGFTPARAGKSLRPLRGGGRGGVHPRSRGEILSSASAFLAALGSPPLARGNQIAEIYPQLVLGFTPARAGKSISDCWGGN